jgi:hypothetical protein
LLLARDAAADAAVSVANLLAPELGWSPDDVRREVDAFLASVEREKAASATSRGQNEEPVGI